MKFSVKTLKCLLPGLLLLPLLQPEAQAFTYNNDNLDTMLCFRKLNAPNPYDLEVNIGSITNLIALSPGAVTNFSGNAYTTAQLTTAIGQSTFEDVKFSVTAAAFDQGFANYPYPLRTTRFTVPRADAATPTTPFARANSSALGLDDTQIDTLGFNATRVTTSPINTATTIGISPGNTQLSCETYLNKLNTQIGMLIENQAPDTFTTAIVSDLYVVVPTGQADPFNANATTGNASYLGFFTFSPDGSTTFTRKSNITLPPKPTLQITSNGSTNVISFVSANNVSYKLYFTNAAGLGTSVTNWPSVSTNITGNGSTVSFTNLSPDASRFYRVSAQ